MNLEKIKRDRQDLERQLVEQHGFLVSSSRAYDSGSLAEAKRLAGIVRTLVYDTKNSRSLLGQLGIKMRIEFFGTCNAYDPRSEFAHEGLVVMGNGQTFYLPNFHMSSSEGQFLDFEGWWAEIVIAAPIGVGEAVQFSRRDLVLNMANTDGGAHVDPELDAKYHALSRGNLAGWKQLRFGEWQDLKPGPELASMRQIAQEVMITLERAYPPLGEVGSVTIPKNADYGSLIGHIKFIRGDSGQ